MPRLLTYAQAAEFLNTTPRHLRQLKTDGRIPFTKIGRLTRFDQRDLEQWLDAQTVRPEAV